VTGALEALGAALLRASLEGAAAVALVGLVVALLPRLPASVRCFLWWAACARFVVALPGWGVAVLPALPAEWSAAATTAVASTAGEAGRPAGADHGSASATVEREQAGAAAGTAHSTRSGDAADRAARLRARDDEPHHASFGLALAPQPATAPASTGEAQAAAAPTAASEPRSTAAIPLGFVPAPQFLGSVESSAPRLTAAAPVPQRLDPVEPAAVPLPAAAPQRLEPVESTAALLPVAAASARQRRPLGLADALLVRLASFGRRVAHFPAALPWLAASGSPASPPPSFGLGRALARLRRLLAGARPVTEGRLAATLAALCRRLRLRPPGLLASPAVRSPLVVGPARPRVLLPEAGLAEMSAAEAEMVLCHELAHLRRRDLWLGWLPSLASTIFFFHPLAALAAREYALAREAACDAEVLRVLGSAPRDYGRLLLRWGLAPRESGLAAAAAAPSRHHLKRRLLMLDRHHHAPRRRALLWAAPAAVALLALLPLRLVATEGEAAILDPSLFAANPSQPAWSGDQAPDPPEPPPRPIDTPAPAVVPAPPPAVAAPPAPPANPGALPTPAPQPPPAVATPAAPSAAPSPSPVPSPDMRVPRGAAPPIPAATPRPVATPAPFAPPARPGAVGSPPPAPRRPARTARASR
jgi:Zn-dependent protease with chaperone function